MIYFLFEGTSLVAQTVKHLPSGRSSGEGNGNPLQYSCLENLVDGGATVHGVTKSRTRLSDFTFTYQLLNSNDTLKGGIFFDFPDYALG